MATEQELAAEWVGLAVDLVLLVVGVWMIASGWTDFGSTVVVISLVGFVVSIVRLWRMKRQPAGG